jgi:hypothetical protein
MLAHSQNATWYSNSEDSNLYKIKVGIQFLFLQES